MVKVPGVCCMVGGGKELWVREVGGMYGFVQTLEDQRVYISMCLWISESASSWEIPFHSKVEQYDTIYEKTCK